MTEKNRQIRFGLTAIKGIGEDSVNLIIAERHRNGKFKSLTDFARRVPAKLMNKRFLQALAFSGALDEFGDRKAIVESLESLAQFAKNFQEKKESGQMGLFGGTSEESLDFALADVQAEKSDILRWERESLGLFVSDHPLKGLENYFSKYGRPIGNLNAEEDASQRRTLHGMVVSVRKMVTKGGKNMAILELEDRSGKIEVAIFPNAYDGVPKKALETDAFLRVKGKIEWRADRPNIIADEIKVGNLAQVRARSEMFGGESERAETEKEYLKIPPKTTKGQIEQVKKILVASRSQAGKSVEVEIDGKKISLPFLVDLSPEQHSEIQRILKI